MKCFVLSIQILHLFPNSMYYIVHAPEWLLRCALIDVSMWEFKKCVILLVPMHYSSIIIIKSIFLGVVPSQGYGTCALKQSMVSLKTSATVSSVSRI